MKQSRFIILILCFGLHISTLTAQGLELGLRNQYRISLGMELAPAWTGLALEAQWAFPLLSDQYELLIGSETGISALSSYSMLKTGLRWKFIQKEKSRIILDWNLLNGVALFRPNSLYEFGSEIGIGQQWQRAGRNDFSYGFMLRFSTIPGYADFSPLYYQTMIPVYFRWHFNKKASRERG